LAGGRRRGSDEEREEARADLYSGLWLGRRGCVEVRREIGNRLKEHAPMKVSCSEVLGREGRGPKRGKTVLGAGVRPKNRAQVGEKALSKKGQYMEVLSRSGRESKSVKLVVL